MGSHSPTTYSGHPVSDSDLCGSVCGRSARRRFHAEPCPYDVVVSLLRALQEPGPTPAAVEHAAATLPVTRFRPDLTPTQPLSRTELIERAGISASSYDRRLSDVRDLDRVTAVQVDGPGGGRLGTRRRRLQDVRRTSLSGLPAVLTRRRRCRRTDRQAFLSQQASATTSDGHRGTAQYDTQRGYRATPRQRFTGDLTNSSSTKRMDTQPLLPS